MLQTSLALAIGNTPHVAAAATEPTAYNNQIDAASKDVQMGSINNNSGRTVSGGVVTSSGLLQPGSHGNNDEYSVGLQFDTEIPPQGATVAEAYLTLYPNAPYDASPNTIKLYVSLEDADAPTALTTASGNLNSATRPRTTATTIIDVTSVTEARLDIDVTAPLQELLDRPGWTGTRIIVLIDTHEDTTVSEWQDINDYTVNPPLLAISATP